MKPVLFPFLFVLVCYSLRSQETFIKRYKNTTLPEGSVAVTNLPNNRIAIIGQQSNGFIWQSPLVIITDSAGNQLRHFVDTSCNGCVVNNGASDSSGFIYVVGHFYGKAGIAKYDSTGNKIWEKLYSPNGLNASFSCVKSINDSLTIVGGSHATDIDGGSAILVAYNNSGDTLWSKYYRYSFLTEIFDIAYNHDIIYATGVVSDTIQPQQRAIFARVTPDGQSSYFTELNNGRKWGYGIAPLSPDSILIGGRADIALGNTYSFLTTVDSMGNVLYTIEDSSYLYNNIVKMDYDKTTTKLYVLDYDTVQVNTDYDYYNHISVFSYPPQNINQVEWEKTIYGTDVSSTRGLALTENGIILHSGYDSNNYCPYLLKADENTCSDLVCDTAFFSNIPLSSTSMATVKLFPNPIYGDFFFLELETDIVIETAEITCFDISGRSIQTDLTGSFYASNSSKAKVNLEPDLAKGLYFLNLTLNGTHRLNARFLKAQ